MGEVNAMKIFRRGQASIEFALILPIFAMLLFALVYVGFLFIDVVTLDSAAAAAARSAAASDDGEPSDAVKDKIKGTTLFLYWYEMDEASPKIKKEEGDKVTETVLEDDPTKKLVRTDIFFTGMVQVKLKNSVKDNRVLRMVLPEKYTVRKVAHTYKEEIKDISAGGD